MLPVLAVEDRKDGEMAGSARERRRALREARAQGLAAMPKLELAYRQKEIDDLLYEEGERFASPGKPRTSTVGQRLQFILDYIFEGNRTEAERIYNGAFPV